MKTISEKRISNLYFIMSILNYKNKRFAQLKGLERVKVDYYLSRLKNKPKWFIKYYILLNEFLINITEF